eukprot:CAMPEP_0168408954 /NCGR_PEP_ID=MMETSP0228-20121227/26937_1 /TAXON_ID=133427 /ORGANISM="Protoceratium reticulatum, Strain CCCM 535 (=CCMP 1889)" /LENGTH=84 /DNA_ID=CAMNT_0008422657 /DNA_START=33 /DNA_END=287 /DNA_ORIENTATION=-
MQPENAIWIGGLDQSVTFKQLWEHGKQAGTAKWAEVFSKGNGALEYSSPEEAANAIAMLNGTALGTCILQCDAWQKKPKEESVV